ncbi:MAG TPA: hypothetical protein VKB84_22385 [Candidatus Binataceae bacterium]|jgi:hypothetical protein|nr:hypothetical protein [Candidatus Binataceae bacterium]
MVKFKKTAAVLVSGFLLTGAWMPARASDESTAFGLHFVPLSVEAATKLPPWLKASDVRGMSVETAPLPKNAAAGTNLAEMDTRDHAEALLTEVGRHIRHAENSSFYSSQAKTEYGAGVRAMEEGKYSEAIEHLRAADKCVSGIPNERVEIG